MRLSAVERWALRTMADLARHAGQGPVERQELAERQGLPGEHLAPSLRQLARVGLLDTDGGAGSGYTLARDAAGITAWEILRAVAETPDPASRADEANYAAPPSVDCDPARWLSARLDQAAQDVLDSVTLADLCRLSGEPTPGSPSRQQPVGDSDTPPGDTRRGVATALDSPDAAYAFQQSIIDGVAEPIMVIGTDYRVRLANRMARKFSAVRAGGSEPVLCYQISHRREVPCDGVAHPCPLKQVRESGEPVTVVHEHYQADGEPRLVEVIASPLRGADGACHGIIECARDITDRTRAEQALQQYAERHRALSERLVEVAESERERLSRELHDQVGQNLTALGINLNIIRTEMPEDALPAAHARLDDSLVLVQQTAERIRDLMANLRPPVLDDYGLLAALRWYGEQFSRRTDISVVVDHHRAVPRLDGRVESALFRITQEALTNVAKHAQATHVIVTLSVDGDALRLVVADDGVGFDLGQLAEPGRGRGWGLLTMTERAEAVGGRCLIEPYPGLGTRVVVAVPL